MKRIYLLCLGALTMGAVQAQITINSSTHYPNVGDSFGYIYTQNPSLNITNVGANQTWDLSGLNSGTVEYFEYFNPSSGVDASNFPNANLMETFGGGENYYVKDANTVAFNGNYIAGVVRHTYTDDRELIKYPMTYNTQFNETFSGTLDVLLSGQSFLRAGTVDIKGTGYGDVILPYTTVNNVLQVTIITEYTDTYLGQVIANYSDTMRLWFSPTHNSYVATVSIATESGSVTDYRASYMDQADFILSAENQLSDVAELDFYPNPSSSEITLLNTENIETISILDMKGVLVQSIPVTTNNQRVNVSTLPNGMYFVQYIFNDEVKVKKLVIQ